MLEGQNSRKLRRPDHVSLGVCPPRESRLFDLAAGAESSPWLYVGVAVGAPLASGVLVIIVVWCVK